MVWGLDMVGPFKKGVGGFTHLLVAVDKFTKWIEAKPITNIRSEEVVKFFLDIIYWFGVPNCTSLTMELTSPKRSFWTLVMDMASGSTGPWSDIHGLTVRLSGPMAWSSKDLSHASSTDSTSTPDDQLQRS